MELIFWQVRRGSFDNLVDVLDSFELYLRVIEIANAFEHGHAALLTSELVQIRHGTTHVCLIGICQNVMAILVGSNILRCSTGILLKVRVLSSIGLIDDLGLHCPDLHRVRGVAILRSASIEFLAAL